MEACSQESPTVEQSSSSFEPIEHSVQRKHDHCVTGQDMCGKKQCPKMLNRQIITRTYQGQRKKNCVLEKQITVRVKDDCSKCHINSLPYSILVEVCSWLLFPELLLRVSLVCKYWNHIAKDPTLWKYLNFQGQTKLTDAILLRLTRLSNRISSLDISDSKLITSQGFVSVIKQCPHIVILKLVRCHQLEEESFTFVGKSCFRLEKAFFDNCRGLSDSSLEAIGKGCQDLTLLSLSQCHNVSDRGICVISNECNKLKNLQLNDCEKLTDKCMETLYKNSSCLEILNISSCNFTSCALSKLVKFKRLKSLEMANCDSVTDDLLITLSQHCTLLDTLNINLCQNVSDKAIDQIARSSAHLRSLTIVACKVTDKGLMSLGNHCKKLEHVDAGWCEAVTEYGAFYLSNICKTLKYFGLMRCDQLSVPACEKLVKEFPHIRYSTMWLDYQRLLARAHKEGLLPAHLTLTSSDSLKIFPSGHFSNS